MHYCIFRRICFFLQEVLNGIVTSELLINSGDARFAVKGASLQMTLVAATRRMSNAGRGRQAHCCLESSMFPSYPGDIYGT
jgi:hypothetical protein